MLTENNCALMPTGSGSYVHARLKHSHGVWRHHRRDSMHFVSGPGQTEGITITAIASRYGRQSVFVGSPSPPKSTS